MRDRASLTPRDETATTFNRQRGYYGEPRRVFLLGGWVTWQFSSCRRKTRPHVSGPTHRHQPHDPQQLGALELLNVAEPDRKRFALIVERMKADSDSRVVELAHVFAP